MRRRAFIIASLALEMVVSPVVGLFFGVFADDYCGTKPWFTIIGAILGVLAAIRTGMRLFRVGPYSERRE